MPVYGKEEIANLTKVIERGNFCDHRGGFLDEFRDGFAKALDCKYAVAGATAMLLMHAIPGAIGAGAGDEIICDPIVQFHGIACLHNNIVPVWTDVRPDDFIMDADKVEEKMTERTKAIWVTHLWGFPSELEKLREIADRHGIYLLEDNAHALFAEYNGRKLGTFGHIATYSFNMGKQLPTGEGGMAVTNDKLLYNELNRRIIFGESPEVLSSNYRMTEFQAAVGVAQLKKAPGYIEEYRKSKAILDSAIEGCAWLTPRIATEGANVAPYHWSCVFRGEEKGITAAVFAAALKETGSAFSMGFVQRPAYKYNFFKIPNAYGNKGCPYNCHLYGGKVDWPDGLCPVAEDVIPRLIWGDNKVSADAARNMAESMRKAIGLAESGAVKPLEYSDTERKILGLIKEAGPLEPYEVIRVFDEKGWEHMDEHTAFTYMEGLRDRLPYKLSHAGPRKFAYHEFLD